VAELIDFIRTTPPERHLAGTASANEVATLPFSLAQVIAAEAIAERTSAAFIGPAGTGKTYAAVTAAASSGLPIVWIDPPVAPRVRALQMSFARALRIEFPDNAPPDLLDRLLITELATTPRVVVVDDARRVGSDGLEELRFLHCQPSALWSLFVVGEGLERILAANRALETRMPYRVSFAPLKKKESLAFARAYHSLLTTAPADLLDAIERVVRGNLRLWAQTLRHILREVDEAPGAVLTDDAVAIALAKLRGVAA
jgi:DNA transposition AAA+ family ATPase